MFKGTKANVSVSDTFLILRGDKPPAQPRIMEVGNVGSISQHTYSVKYAPRQKMRLLSPLLSSAILHISNVFVCVADILQRNNITCAWKPAGDIAKQYPFFIRAVLTSRKRILFYFLSTAKALGNYTALTDKQGY